MKTRLLERATATALAVIVTLGLFGGIDHLAGREPVSAQWASAVTAPRG